jgi:eukaryotic-like serine/threonine-protein kinase
VGKEITPGARVGRTTILRHVATGGMGSVWQGERVGADGVRAMVALKTIRPELAGDATFKAMFLEEARIASRLSHPNVARVLDVVDDEGTTSIAFEWVEGPSLEGLCARAEDHGEAMALPLALRVLADVCAGLHAVHELRNDAGELLHVVHRDVTPTNVLIGQDGVAKLIDLGLAKARDRAGAPTRSGIAKGTPQFMAPEQAMGQPVDRRADVFAAGALLYRVLAGRAPFRDHDALAAFVMGRPPPELPEEVPAPVRAFVAKAMCSDPDERFATAAEMRATIAEMADLDSDAPRRELRMPAALEPSPVPAKGTAAPAARGWLVVGLALAAGLVAAALALALRS